jgi:hypothetical protein
MEYGKGLVPVLVIKELSSTLDKSRTAVNLFDDLQGTIDSGMIRRRLKTQRFPSIRRTSKQKRWPKLV